MVLEDEDIPESLKNFYLGIKTEATKRTYYYTIMSFLNHIGLGPEEIVEKAKEDPEWVEKSIIKYVHDREKLVSGNYIKVFKASIKLFMDMNDVEGINWGKISRLHGSFLLLLYPKESS
ncbi:MAG: hypothetical protein L6N94_02795 [Candidatus Methylarchaceae archaeon HK01M]|nr:hypothetical protein [Candidatus Methylarchaceae archaeon HK01M]